MYFNLFKIIPVAQTSIIDNMEDAIFVLDKTNQVLSLNPAAEKLVQVSASRSIGKSIQFFSSLVSAMDRAGFSWTSNTAREGEIELTVQGDIKTYNTRLLPLTSGEDTQDGKILLLHDITEKKQYEREREQLISKLQRALAEVKTLNGLLPICASCKKIRDDQGYWQEVEQYIGSRTDADFSHGLCPECFKKLFPDNYREKYEHAEEDGSNKEIDTKTN
ncbi:PAS domain S-box protein [Gracilinema caldarium]|uniref:PAS domain S-box protein n=1 Tax=Gracilinema caldarium TaxID=215591 RepID=UPI00350E593D